MRENMPKTCVRACKERNRRFGMMNGIMCEMNDFRFRIVLTRTHAGFLVFLPHFFFTETLRTIGRVSTHPAHSTQCLRATGRAAQCAAPTKPSLLNQRNMYVDHVKRSRQKSSERKQKTPIRRGGTLARPPCWRNVIPCSRAQKNRKKQENMPKLCVRACKDNPEMKIVHLTHESILIPHQRSFSLHARTQEFGLLPQNLFTFPLCRRKRRGNCGA